MTDLYVQFHAKLCLIYLPKPNILHTNFCKWISLQVQIIRAGNKKVLNKLMGEVQRETKGRTDPVQVRAILEEMISWTAQRAYFVG